MATGELAPVEGVGGHGGLLSDGDWLLKPVPDSRAGRMELKTYQDVEAARRDDTASTPAWWTRHGLPSRREWHHFMPRFGGEQSVRGPDPDASSARYLRLQHLTAGLRRPCVLDIKVGVQSWGEDATPAKAAKEAGKWPAQRSRGFRLSGSHTFVRDADSADGWTRHTMDRAAAYKMPEDGLPHVLREFVCGVLEVLREFLPRLRLLLECMRQQHGHRFYGSSLLFVYDAATLSSSSPATADAPSSGSGSSGSSGGGGEPWGSGCRGDVDVRMIDFGHVWPIPDGDGVDDGYILGLQNIIEAVEAAVAPPAS